MTVKQNEFKMLAKLDKLDEEIVVSRSHAKLCITGMELEKDKQMHSLKDLCKDKTQIKFELEPKKRIEWFALKPEQKNIL